MAINYQNLQSMAASMLQDNGQAITFSYTSGQVINPATGVVSAAGSTTNVAGYGVTLNFRAAEIDGQSVLTSDLKLIANNVSSEPQAGWKVQANSKTYRVMTVSPINPAGTNVIYICQIRE
jgi:hypothetical protein